MERIFEAENGTRVTAINEVQADAFLNAGFVEVTEEEPKKKK